MTELNNADGNPSDSDCEESVAPNAANCNRNRANFWVDIAIALVFSALVGTGVLLEFVLTHGRGSAWLGFGRHDWGEVHFILAVVLFGLIVTHLILHRAWVARCWTRFAGSLRSPLTWVLVSAVVVLMVLPLIIPAQAGPGRGDRTHHRLERAGGDGDYRHQRPRRGGGHRRWRAEVD